MKLPPGVDVNDWENPETIRFLARDRSAHLKKVQTDYLLQLDDLTEAYVKAADAYQEALSALREVRARLAPLNTEIAHLEAVAATETPTLAMLFPKLATTERTTDE